MRQQVWFGARVGLLALFSSLLSPFAAVTVTVAAPLQAPVLATQPPLVTAPPVVPPVEDLHHGNLLLNAWWATESLTVGATTVLSLTVTNTAKQDLHGVQVTLPVPVGVQLQVGAVPVATATPLGTRPVTAAVTPGDVLPAIPTLAAGASTTQLVQVTVTAFPTSRAIVLQPTVTATERATPVSILTGVAVLDSTAAPVTVAFTPGRDSQLRSGDGVSLTFPGAAATVPLTLVYRATVTALAALQAAKQPVPPDFPLRGRGLPLFTLDAYTTDGQAVHKFAAPLTLTVPYSNDQLIARGLSAATLSLFYLDEPTQTWQRIASTVDETAQTVTAQFDHFTPLALGSDNNPAQAYMPTLQGWQTSLASGAASYSLPIEVPAGPAGQKPKLTLSYSSAANDGPDALRLAQQSGWVGKGWSLDTGYVSVTPMSDSAATTYSLVVDGMSFRAHALHLCYFWGSFPVHDFHHIGIVPSCT